VEQPGLIGRGAPATAAARLAGLGFDRFTRTVGLPPMAYLLAWRMALAKTLLRQDDCSFTLQVATAQAA
jgi:methylphosphotriester-DNA--protein-cysteine methyltransferase